MGGATRQQTRMVLGEAASLAAAFYADDSVANLDFVMSPTRGGSECWTVDWQTPQESSPLTDISYFLGSSLEVDQRREWERSDLMFLTVIQRQLRHCLDLDAGDFLP